MKRPTATFVKMLNNRKKWHKGTALYQLSEPVTVIALGFHTCTSYVLAAVSPEAADHHRPETTIFAANKDGSFFGGFMDRDAEDPEDHTYVERMGYEDAEFERCRVVGVWDHAASLKKLGYKAIGAPKLVTRGLSEQDRDFKMFLARQGNPCDSFLPFLF